jgi:hypothetical protein
MKILTKSLLSAGAAAAALVGVASPAIAAHGNRDSINAGDIIAGALIIGGLAAVLSGDDRYDNGRNDDGRGYRGGRDGSGYGYDNRGNGRDAVNRCVATAERWASRYGQADVTEVRDIDRTRYGYKISGNLVLRDGWRGNDGRGYEGRGRGDDHERNERGREHGGAWNNYRGDDDRGYGYGRGGNGYNRGYDKGRFTCYVEQGRVVDIRYSGLDQWR